MDDRGGQVIEQQFGHRLHFAAACLIPFRPISVGVRNKGQIWLFDENSEVLRSGQHGALDELNLQLLPGVLEHVLGRLQLLAYGAQLPQKD